MCFEYDPLAIAFRLCAERCVLLPKLAEFVAACQARGAEAFDIQGSAEGDGNRREEFYVCRVVDADFEPLATFELYEYHGFVAWSWIGTDGHFECDELEAVE